MLPSMWKDEIPGLAFRPDLDRLFQSFFGGKSPTWPLGENGPPPAMDVRETEEAWKVEVELPGMKQNEVEVKIEEGILTIGAERRQEEEKKNGTYHRTERYYGRMERRFTLPPGVEADTVEAEYKDGLLRITLPKKAGAKTKAVAVKVG